MATSVVVRRTEFDTPRVGNRDQERLAKTCVITTCITAARLCPLVSVHVRATCFKPEVRSLSAENSSNVEALAEQHVKRHNDLITSCISTIEGCSLSSMKIDPTRLCWRAKLSLSPKLSLYLLQHNKCGEGLNYQY